MKSDLKEPQDLLGQSNSLPVGYDHQSFSFVDGGPSRKTVNRVRT